MSKNRKTDQAESEIINLKTGLQIQDKSIVSRVLMKNPGGTVTLFAFGEGEGLSEHTAPFDALVVCIEGETEISIADKQYRLQEGDSITMPANIPHSVQAVTDFKMLLVMIKSKD